MATTDNDEFKKKEAYLNNNFSDLQYNNINLNQSNLLSSETTIKSVNLCKDKKENNCCYTNYTEVDKCSESPKLIDRKPYDHINLNELFKKDERQSKHEKHSTINASTLSLHIEAYENSNKAIDFEWIPKDQQRNPHSKQQKMKKLWEKEIQEERKLQAFFEIPRQQDNEEVKTPEVAQYMASQVLLDPNSENKEDDKGAFNDEKMFNIVFNGSKMSGLKVIPLPDKLTVPRKKGIHLHCYSINQDDVKIVKAHNDDYVPWCGKSRTKNFIITRKEDGTIKAKESQISSIVTHGQCYYVTHGKYAEKNMRVRKKIYSATTPSSPSPAPNTLIVVLYDIEKDIDETDGLLKPNSSSDMLPITVQQKRPADTPPQAAKEKLRKTPSSSGLIGFDKNTFFGDLPLTSPVSSKPTTSFLTDKMKIDKLEKQLAETTEKLEKELTKREEMKANYDDLYQKWYRLNQQLNRAKDKISDNKHEILTQSETEIENLKMQLEKAENNFFELLEKMNNTKGKNDEQIKELENEIMTLKEEQSSKEFKIKVNEKYVPAAKFTMSKLVNFGVSVNAVGPVMQCVAEMCGLTLNAIPSARTVAKSPFITQYFNNEQIKRVITGFTSATTVCTDETKKNGYVWQNYIAITRDEENAARAYCLGNVPVTDKSADTSIKALGTILESLNTDDGIDYWETFIMSLGNRMSDEAATEKLFTKRLEGLRRVLIDSQSQYDHLTEKQKDDLSKLRSFFCQLHVLQNLTPIVTNVLLENEKDLRDNTNLQQPAILLCLRTIAKHLSNRSASRYSSKIAWDDYCRTYNILFGKIPDFIGNRFNIVFAIAACVFYLRLHIIDFIEKFDTELRHTQVLQWLKDPIIISHLHILAAFNAYVTAPLLRITEHSTSITVLTAHAESLIEYLEKVKENPITLFTGHPPFEEVEEAEEATLRSLSHIVHLDNATQMHPEILVDAIEELADATISYFKKKYESFLPGGEHYLTSADTITVPLHNKSCEHNFGLLTADYHRAPNKRAAVRGIKVQATINKVYAWYEKLSPEEKAKLLQEALINAPILENNAALQQQAYEEARWNRLLQKQREDDIANEIKSRKQAEANLLVQKYGGCWNEEQMNTYLRQNTIESEKRKAVEAQLKFHKLLPTTDKNDIPLCYLTMFNDQRKRVPKSLEVLERNLGVLIYKKERRNEEAEEDEY